ncbi:MAG: hypothetical protein H0X17_05295 [Deltaproteobacteria bacterium]|nr:hypothetical protein [Deltaproteobacteria bacterium]
MTAAKLGAALSFDAGRELARVFAGVGAESGAAGDPYRRGPRTGFDVKMYAVAASVSAWVGPVELGLRATIDDATPGDDGDRPLTSVYDEAMLVGFGESHSAGTGELSLVYDGRHPTHRWIPAAAPSTGFYVRAAAAYTQGDASRTGSFSTSRGTLEARRLFDLFRGDRVLSIGMRVEAVTADATALPFDRLPGLGGPQRLRALARDELRDRSAAAGDVEYEWALGGSSRAYLFVETGAVQPGLDDLAASQLHLGFGGGLRLLTGAATSVRLQLAGSADGDLGFYLQLGAL